MTDVVVTFSGTGALPGAFSAEQGSADVSSDKLRITAGGWVETVLKHSTSLSGATQYLKMVSGTTDFQYPLGCLRYTNSSSGYYVFYVDGNAGTVEWGYKPNVGTSSTGIQTSGGLPGAPFYSGESVGIIVDGTGSATEVRLWSNITADAPTDASTWDGRGPDATLTNNPGTAVNSGPYACIGASQGTANQVQFTKFAFGDIGGSTPVDLAGAATAAATATGALSHGVPLAGGATGQATGTGALSHGVPLQGDAAAAADATADVSVSGASLIAFRSLSSAPQSGIGSVLFRQPDTLENTDLALWCVVNKYPTNGPNTPTGYALTAQAVMGDGGAAGADQGDVYATVFHRVCDGTEDAATESISIPSGNAAYSRSIAFSRSGGTGWDIATAAGSQGAASASWSVVTGSLDLAAGDTVLVFVAKNSDLDVVGHSAHSLSATGVTFGTFNSRAGPTGTTSGDDVAYQIGEVQVTAGSGSGPVTFTMSATGSAGNSSGGVMLVRLRASTAVDLAGAAVVAGSATGGLSHGVPLQGGAAGAATAAAGLTHGVPLQGSAAGQATATAGMTHGVPVAGAAAGQAAATGDLAHGVPLAGTAAGSATAAAQILVRVSEVELFGRRPRPGRGPYSVGRYFQPRADAYTPRSIADLAGAAVSVSTAGGGLSISVTLSAAAAAQAAASGGLSLQVPLAGSAVGQATASADFSGTVSLSGAAAGQSAATATMTHGAPLAGAAAGSAAGAAALSIAIPISADAQAIAAAAGGLSITVNLSGAAVAQATAGASFDGVVQLAGAGAGAASGTGALSLTIGLVGSAAAQATAGGSMTHGVPLEGDAQASGSAAGTLVPNAPLSTFNRYRVPAFGRNYRPH
jgi:hypothetical protein